MNELHGGWGGEICRCIKFLFILFSKCYFVHWAVQYVLLLEFGATYILEVVFIDFKFFFIYFLISKNFLLNSLLLCTEKGGNINNSD